MKTTKKEKPPARKSVMITDDLEPVINQLCKRFAEEKSLSRVSEGGAVRLALLEAAERRGIQNNGKGR